jgi:hypothetical protein
MRLTAVSHQKYSETTHRSSGRPEYPPATVVADEKSNLQRSSTLSEISWEPFSQCHSTLHGALTVPKGNDAWMRSISRSWASAKELATRPLLFMSDVLR